MKPLRYFFLRNYELNIRQRAAIPWLRPLGLIALFTGLNAFAVLVICNELWSDAAVKVERKSELKSIAIAWVIATFTILYLRWIRSGRYLVFKDEFRGEPPGRRKVHTVLLFVYGIASLLAPPLVGYWTFLRRGGM